MLSKKTYIALGLVAVQVIALVILSRSSGRTDRPSVLPSIAAKDIEKIEISHGKDVVQLVRLQAEKPAPASDGGVKGKATAAKWQMKKPVDYLADASAVKTLLGRLEKMTVSAEPISTKKDWHDSKYGVGDKKAYKIHLFGSGGKTIASFLLGKSAGGRTFLRLPDKDGVYQALGIMSYAFAKKPADWRDKTIFKLKESDITKVAIRGQKSVVLARQNKKWTLVEPTNIKLDQSKAKALARTFATLRAKSFADDGAKDTGLDKPAAVINATTKDGKTHSLVIGKDKGKYETYVRRADQKTVYLIGSWQSKQLNKSPEDIKELEPIIPKPEENDVRRITLGSAPSTVLVRSPKGWRMMAPKAQDADPNAVRELLGEVKRMNVPRTSVGGKKKHAEFLLTAAKGYPVQLFGAGGKRLSAFYLGKRDKGQVYVRKMNDDKVYRAYGLNPQKFKRSVKSWRSKVVMSFRAADVQALELRRGNSALRVARQDKDWKIEKPKPAKASTKKVNDLLATLSNFFATDFAPQTKPSETGLGQPALRIKVELKGQDARTLLVGKKNPKGQYFAKRAGGQEVYLLAAWQVPRIDKKFADLVALNGQKK